MCEVLAAHFRTAGAQSRCMVFTTFRDSVVELKAILEGVDGVRPMQFVGPARGKGDDGASGMKQNQQREVVRSFKQGGFNVLVSTSIGEEGLDIGDVDLIINYDAPKSAIRQTQRAGRTGRKHVGRVVYLITTGARDSSFRNIKTIAECPADEIMNAAKVLPLFPAHTACCHACANPRCHVTGLFEQLCHQEEGRDRARRQVQPINAGLRPWAWGMLLVPPAPFARRCILVWDIVGSPGAIRGPQRSRDGPCWFTGAH